MAALQVFDFRDYKDYLRALLQSRFPSGSRTRLATALRCHTAYVSRVLNAEAQLSLEQAELFNSFAGHDEEESHFFLLLVEQERAGTATLKRYFNRQIDKILEARMLVRNRIRVRKALSIEDQATYYSHWHYSAIHMAVAIPGLNSKEALAAYLSIPLLKIAEALSFLLETGLVVRQKNGLARGPASIHLGGDSPLRARHHSNWRMRAIQSLDDAQSGDLHYSSVVTLSNKDMARAREILVQAIEQIRNIVQPSPDEEVCSYSVDLFSLRRN